MKLLALQHFMGRVNEMFLAVLNDGEVPFQLVEAGALPVHSAAMPRMRLSLFFRNTSLSLFPQQIYRLRHPTIGKVEVVLVPVGRDRDGFLYQRRCSINPASTSPRKPLRLQ